VQWRDRDLVWDRLPLGSCGELMAIFFSGKGVCYRLLAFFFLGNVSFTHLRAPETGSYLVFRLLLLKKKKK
ncbi:hypothetical protein, partial [Neisseria meningitidis]|uniref:hypothetical protein n=1 Tax=Neisseria meningitidis TaxID=487 RepID=UPI000CBBD318